MTSAVQLYRKVCPAARCKARTSSDFMFSLESLADLLQRPSAFLQAVLRLSPAVLKSLAALILLINIRSWPLVWHCAYAAPLFVLLR